MSVAFSPTPKDQRKLSTDRDSITPKESFRQYEKLTSNTPAGTWGLSVGAVLDAHKVLPADVQDAACLGVLHDGGTDGLPASHASIVFTDSFGPEITTSKSRKHDERLAAELKREAIDNRRLYPPTEA